MSRFQSHVARCGHATRSRRPERTRVRSRSRRSLIFEPLEDRLLLSHDLAGHSLEMPPPWQLDAAVAENFVPDQYIVTLQDGVDAHAFAEELRGQGRTVFQVYSHALNGLAFRGPVLGDDPRILSIEPDQFFHTLAQDLPTGVDRIDADLSALAQIDGSDERVDVDIAIIDTGIDRDHPDLNVYAAGSRNFAGTCSFIFCTPPDPPENWDDLNGHGTHVAGSAAALDNGFGVVGVAPGARVWAIRVLDQNGTGTLSWIINGIDYVTANAGQIEVANMSLGAQTRSDALRTAIQNSVNAGVFYAVAAGNSAIDVYGPDGVFNTSDDFIPAAYPEVATVSALADFDGQVGGLGSGGFSFSICKENTDDSLACFSNFSSSVVASNPVSSPGAAIDVAAPGVGILSTWNDGGYNTISGTSMASPHVAGAAALYIAQHGRDVTGDGFINAADVYVIRQALIDSAQPQSAWRSDFNTQDPDANREPLVLASSGPVDALPTVTFTSPANGATVSGIVIVTADASDDDAVTQVEFFVNGTSIAVDTNGADGWSASWDTTATDGVGNPLYPDGPYTVAATATDSAAQTKSHSIDVTVDNMDEPPSVAIASPASGAFVSGSSVAITANASDDRGITQVEFFADGISIGVDTDGSDGWSAVWDTTSFGDGGHTVSATATDTAAQADSDNRNVTVDNTAPTVAITSPADGATLSGMVTVSANASDATSGVAQVEFFVDGASIGVDSNGSDGWSVNWDTTQTGNGSYNLTAIATDAAASTSTSDPVGVSVQNAGDTNMMYVWEITWSERQRGKGGSSTDLFFTIDVNRDADGDSSPESADEAVQSATVDVWLLHDTDQDGVFGSFFDTLWVGSAGTNKKGQVTFVLRDAPTGDYQVQVVGLSHATYTWDSTLDADNPDWYFGVPGGSEIASTSAVASAVPQLVHSPLASPAATLTFASIASSGDSPAKVSPRSTLVEEPVSSFVGPAQTDGEAGTSSPHPSLSQVEEGEGGGSDAESSLAELLLDDELLDQLALAQLG